MITSGLSPYSEHCHVSAANFNDSWRIPQTANMGENMLLTCQRPFAVSVCNVVSFCKINAFAEETVAMATRVLIHGKDWWRPNWNAQWCPWNHVFFDEPAQIYMGLPSNFCSHTCPPKDSAHKQHEYPHACLASEISDLSFQIYVLNTGLLRRSNTLQLWGINVTSLISQSLRLYVQEIQRNHWKNLFGSALLYILKNPLYVCIYINVCIYIHI